MKGEAVKVSTVVVFQFLLAFPQGSFAEGLRGGFDDAFGSRFQPGTHITKPDVRHRPRHGLDRATGVRHWNQVAIDASGLDHTPVAPGEARVFGEQVGPGRASRAMAMVHLAVFEVVNAIEGGYKSYVGLGPSKLGTSLDAAVAQAAHDTLTALFPSQGERFDAVLTEELGDIRDGRTKSNGIALGKRAAAAILVARANDGSQRPEPRVGIEFLTSNDPGKWRQDPVSQIPLALGAYLGRRQTLCPRASESISGAAASRTRQS